jgi:hypothetical protein
MPSPLANLSQAGINFLKCAFAEPDFDTTGSMGVPDNYAGRSLGKLHAYNTGFAFAAGMDTYFMQIPFPGVAYWTLVVPNGAPLTGTWQPVTYSDSDSMGFGIVDTPTLDTSSQFVSSFRSVSLAFEMIPTVNEMQWAGTVSSARFPVRLTQYPSTAGALSIYVTGIGGLERALTVGYSGNLYTAAFNRGVYSCSLNRAPEFEFHDMQAVIVTGNVSINIATDGLTLLRTPQNSNTGITYITGIDDLDTIVTRVSSPPGAVNSAIIKTWHCVEYVPAPGSALYEYSHVSPPSDPEAIRVYKAVASQLPTAVSCYDNATFWQRVIGLAANTLAFARHVPGFVGAVANGANSLITGMRAMGITE